MKKIYILLLFLIGSVAMLSVIFFLKQNPKKEFSNSGITFDSAYTNSSGDQYTNFSSWTHTVGSKPNRILIVGVSLKSKNPYDDPQITSITFAGSPLREFKKVEYEENKTFVMYLFYLVNPERGAKNIIVKTKNSTAISAGSFVFSGVSQKISPEVLFSSWQTPQIDSLKVKKEEVLFDFISAEHPPCIAIPSQPQRLLWASYGGKNGGILAGGASYKKIILATSSSVMSWKKDSCPDENTSDTNWLYFVGKLLPVN